MGFDYKGVKCMAFLLELFQKTVEQVMNTTLYKEIFIKLPYPLNDGYIITIVLASLLLFVLAHIFDIGSDFYWKQMSKSHQYNYKDKVLKSEIEKLMYALNAEREQNKQQINRLVRNFENYSAEKEYAIAKLSSEMVHVPEDDRDAKQAEIDRLTSELNRMRRVQQKAIAEKEAEVSNLTREISNIKSKSREDINRLTEELQTAQDTQKELQAENERLQAQKAAEIYTIRKKARKEISGLRGSLIAAEKKVTDLNQAYDERETELAKLQNRLAETELSNASEYEALNKQIEVIRKERDVALRDKKHAENEISSLNGRIRNIETSSKEQIAAKQAEIDELMLTKVEPEVKTSKKSLHVEPQAVVSEPHVEEPAATVSTSEDFTRDIVKPTFGGYSPYNEGSEFNKIMAQQEASDAKSQEIEKVRKSNAAKAKETKRELERQLIVEAKAENAREIHEEDAATLSAIDEQKRKALELDKREEERAKNGGSKRFGFFNK